HSTIAATTVAEVQQFNNDSGPSTQNASFVNPLAAGNIVMNSVTTNGSIGMTLTYSIQTSPVAAFRIGIYQSTDSQFNTGDLLLGTLSISQASDLTVGTHVKTVQIGSGPGQIPLPGAGLADTNSDYRILAQADDLNPTQDPDNTAVLAG